MSSVLLPTLLFVMFATLLAGGMLAAGMLLGPRRNSAVKQMPYESGMDPVHDTRRRFDVRFHLVAIAFLIFDVEILFLYPWAVASRNPEGIDRAIAEHMIDGRGMVFAGVIFFLVTVTLGLVYEWRRGILRWR